MEIRVDDFLPGGTQEIEQRRNIECMVSRGEGRQVLFRQLEELNGRAQAPAVFCVRWVLEILLEMNEGAGGLNQSFEEIVVVAIAVQPNLFQNVMRFVVTLFVPAAKKRAIKRVVRHVAGKIDIVAFQLAHKLRNPLAFAHGGLNFIVPQMMGKPTFPEGHESVRGRSQE